MTYRGKKTSHRGIRSLGQGRYQLSIFVRGREHIRTIAARNLREAAAQRYELTRELETGKPKHSTFGDVAKAWLARRKAKRLAPTTLARYQVTLDRWLLPFLGSMALTEVTASDLLDWQAAVGSQLAASTTNGHLRVLRSVLTEADWQGRLPKALPEDDGRITEDEPNLLTQSELQRFLVHGPKAMGPRAWALAMFLLTTGARISTARAVRWEDLDHDRGCIHLRRRLSMRETLDGVKRSRRSKDVVPLLPMLVRALEPLPRGPSGLVFESPRTKGPVARSYLDKPLTKGLAAAEITKRLTPHGLRRTAALVYRQGGSSKLAKEILGHATDKMAAHYAPELFEERAEAAAKAFEGLAPAKPGLDSDPECVRASERP